MKSTYCDMCKRSLSEDQHFDIKIHPPSSPIETYDLCPQCMDTVDKVIDGRLVIIYEGKEL